jgi:hypothetical protein
MPVSDLQKPNPAGDPALAQYPQQYLDAIQTQTPKSMFSEAQKAIYLLLAVREKLKQWHEMTSQRREMRCEAMRESAV